MLGVLFCENLGILGKGGIIVHVFAQKVSLASQAVSCLTWTLKKTVNKLRLDASVKMTRVKVVRYTIRVSNHYISVFESMGGIKAFGRIVADGSNLVREVEIFLHFLRSKVKVKTFTIFLDVEEGVAGVTHVRRLDGVFPCNFQNCDCATALVLFGCSLKPVSHALLGSSVAVLQMLVHGLGGQFLGKKTRVNSSLSPATDTVSNDNHSVAGSSRVFTTSVLLVIMRNEYSLVVEVGTRPIRGVCFGVQRSGILLRVG